MIRFQWEITAPRPVLLPGFPIHLDVFKAGVDEPVPETVFTEPLLVDIARWRGAARAKLLAVAGAGTLLLAGFTTWIVKARKRRGLAREGVFTEDGERSLERLTRLGEALNACRVRGDTLGFLQAALEIHRHAQNMETPESREIRQRMEQARYGGLRLTGEEMDAHHRRLRRLLKPAGKT